MKKDPLKILMIAPTPYYADRGCHWRINREVKYLQDKGYQIDILTYHIGRNIAGGNKIIRIKGLEKYNKLSAGPSYGKILLDIQILFYALKIVSKYDIVHAHLHEGSLIAIILKIIKGKPFIFDYQGSLSEESVAHNFIKRKGLIYKLFLFIERLIESLSPIIITSSMGGYKKMKRKHKNKKVFLAHDGKEEIKTEENKYDTFTFVYTGVLSAYQGVDDILYAAKRLKEKKYDFNLILVGYPDTEKYNEITMKYDIQGQVYNKLDIEKLKQIIKKSHVGLSLKKSYSEGNGKLLLYMGANLPVIAMDRETDRYIYKDAGLYVKDRDELFDAMEKILMDKVLYDKLKDRVKEIERNFNWEKTAETISNLYCSLV